MAAAIRRYTRMAFLLMGFLCLPVFANADVNTLDLSLEELMSVEVTSAAKKPQELRDIPAAVHIISAEDIRRSGALSIPEALRLAPGVQVLAINNNRWSVSIRGGAREYSNKLLVLVDGRSVYSPTYSGVMWDALDVPLENILRIEVIRGPGASMWGSNAVNGVINIITRQASDTQDGLAVLAAGNNLRDSAFLRYGYKHSEDTSVRFHARGFEFGQSDQKNGQNGEDAWSNRSAGFRVDRGSADSNQKFMLQGNAFISHADDESVMASRPPAIEDVLFTQRTTGLNLTARWDKSDDKYGDTALNASLEDIALKHILFDERRQTFEIERTHRFSPLPKHDFVWGLGARLTNDNIKGTRFFRVPEQKKTNSLYRLFFNDEIACSDKLKLSLSAGLEHNDYTGFELQPSLRLMLTPDENNSIWLAASRAARTPNRLEKGPIYILAARLKPVPLVAESILDIAESEKLDALDYGWKHKFSTDLAMDLSGFYFKYKDGAGASQAGMAPDPAGYLVVTRAMNNDVKADFRGMEASLDWQPDQKWKLQGVYSLIDINLAIPANCDPIDIRKNVPARIYSLFSRYDLSEEVEWDVWYRHCGAIEAGAIAGYDTVDSRLAWKIRKNSEISLVAQNVFDKRHEEFVPRFVFSKQREFGRSVYVKSEWSF